MQTLTENTDHKLSSGKTKYTQTNLNSLLSTANQTFLFMNGERERERERERDRQTDRQTERDRERRERDTHSH